METDVHVLICNFQYFALLLPFPGFYLRPEKQINILKLGTHDINLRLRNCSQYRELDNISLHRHR